MKLYRRLIFGCFLFVLALASCKENDFEPERTATSELAGEWFVKLLQDNEDVLGGYFKIITSNTASNTPDSIWIISADTSALALKVKVAANVETLSFNGSGNERIYGGTVTVTDGKILMDQATSTGGNQTDSIYFNAEIPYINGTTSSEPGVTYTIAGYRRTGFTVDEH